MVLGEWLCEGRGGSRTPRAMMGRCEARAFAGERRAPASSRPRASGRRARLRRRSPRCARKIESAARRAAAREVGCARQAVAGGSCLRARELLVRQLSAPAERDLERGAWVRRHDLGILHLVPRDLRRGRLVEVRCSRGTAELLLAQRRAWAVTRRESTPPPRKVTE